MGKTKKYEGDGITVIFEPRRCIHAAACVHGLPEVFDANRRPWIDATKADADSLAAAVERCPTGALSYERTDGAPQETVPERSRIEVVKDGPLHVRGKVEIDLPDGTVQWSGTRAALCRCGASKNKPFCDNAHVRVGFTDPPS